MNDVIDLDRLAQAIEETGGTWLSQYPDADRRQFLESSAREIHEFRIEYKKRFGDSPDPFALLEKNLYHAKAFFQLDTLKTTVDIKIMVWRILLGCELTRIRFEYDAAGETSLAFTIHTPYGAEDPPYVGDPFRDFRVLRHLGITRSDGRLLVQGYYAFKA